MRRHWAWERWEQNLRGRRGRTHLLHFAAEFAATLDLNLGVFKLARHFAGGTDMQMVTAVNDLVQFAFDFNGSSSDFAGDFSRLANKDFFRGQLAIYGAVNGGFWVR